MTAKTTKVRHCPKDGERMVVPSAVGVPSALWGIDLSNPRSRSFPRPLQPPPLPPPLGPNLLPRLLQWLGPKGLEFGRYSIDYHTLRNCPRPLGARSPDVTTGAGSGSQSFLRCGGHGLAGTIAHGCHFLLL